MKGRNYLDVKVEMINTLLFEKKIVTKNCFSYSTLFNPI